MTHLDILGQTMWLCCKLRARLAWQQLPSNRWRIVSHEEATAHMLDGPEEIREWIERKKSKPGQYL